MHHIQNIISTYYLVLVVVVISFEARLIHDELPSKLMFAQNVLKGLQLSSLAYGILIVNKRITCITNEGTTSTHDGVSTLHL